MCSVLGQLGVGGVEQYDPAQWFRKGGMKSAVGMMIRYLSPSDRTCSNIACRQHNLEERGHRLVQHRSCLPIVIVMMTMIMSRWSCMQCVTGRDT